MTAHADAINASANGHANGTAPRPSIPPGFALIRDAELSALIRVLTAARATLAHLGEGHGLDALQDALDAVPPALAQRREESGDVRHLGGPLYAVASRSKPGTVHIVTAPEAEPWRCDCQGWEYRGTCSHVREVSEYNARLAGGLVAEAQ